MAAAIAVGAATLAVAQAPGAALDHNSPFAQKSALPFEAPPFDRIHDKDYEPALMAGMAEQKREIRAIADAKSAPTFSNTIVALEESGMLLDRTQSALSALAGAYTNPQLEDLQQKMAPLLSAHNDSIYLDEPLFLRVKAVYDGRTAAGLKGEDLRLTEITYRDFVHAGAELQAADKAKLKALNEEESTLSNDFSRKLLAATKAGGYLTTDKAALAGLNESEVAAAAAGAKSRGAEGYLLPLQNTTQQPALAELSNRGTRQALFDASWTRAEKGGENDTRGHHQPAGAGACAEGQAAGL